MVLTYGIPQEFRGGDHLQNVGEVVLCARLNLGLTCGIPPEVRGGDHLQNVGEVELCALVLGKKTCTT